MRSVFIICILFISTALFPQQKSGESLIQFTGAVFNQKDEPIPYVNIVNTRKNIGQITNEQGIFSIVVSRLDTIVFSYVGYKKRYIVIPDSVKNAKFSKFVYLSEDTIYLRGVTVRPWPERSRFREVFLSIQPKDPAGKVSSYAGFVEREAPVEEPKPTIFNPASLLFNGIEKMILKKRKRKKAREAPVWSPD